jgi:hypothetical protein
VWKLLYGTEMQRMYCPGQSSKAPRDEVRGAELQVSFFPPTSYFSHSFQGFRAGTPYYKQARKCTRSLKYVACAVLSSKSSASGY